MVPFVQTPHALANGTVDAAVVFQPYIDEIESLVGNQTVMWPIQAGQLAYVDAICTQNWAAAHPELITRFLKALIQAEDFTFHHQDEAKATVAKTLNYTDTYLTTIWSDYQFSISIEQSQILAMENEARWLIRNNLTTATSVPDFLKYIYVEGLESIRPESVNIIG
jgi:NitT/TauT family transport system substrate-binding protein